MLFTKKDVGKRVIMLETAMAAWLTIGCEYIIERVDLNGTVVFKDKVGNKLPPWIGLKENVKFLDERPILPGDEVIIIKETTSFKSNERLKVIGYICDNPDKLEVEGCLPGGWIKASSVVKVTDITNLRFKTPWELIKEYGMHCLQLVPIKEYFYPFAGRPLSDADVMEDSRGLYVKTKDLKKRYDIQEVIYTDKPKEELRLVLGDPALLSNCITTTSQKFKEISKRCHKIVKYKEGDADDDPALIFEILLTLGRAGQIPLINTGYLIPAEVLKVIPAKEVVKENELKQEMNDVIKKEGPTIPF